MAAAVSGLSPVIITVRIPISRSCTKRSTRPSLITSLRYTTPSILFPSTTTNGVPPVREIWSTIAISSGGVVPLRSSTYARIVSAAPLRSCRPSGRSTPDIRVCAVNSTSSAPGDSVTGERPRSPVASVMIDLPSGVSSAALAATAASASSSRVTPWTGVSSTARRLP